jgi:hypothetical protein
MENSMLNLNNETNENLEAQAFPKKNLDNFRKALKMNFSKSNATGSTEIQNISDSSL